MIKIISCINFDQEILTKNKLFKLVENTQFKTGSFEKSECLRMGFTKIKSPLENQFLESAGGDFVLCKFLIGAKKVKASTIKIMAEERLEQMKSKGYDGTLKQCKEDVRNELLNVATPDYVDFWVLFDYKNNLAYTDRASTHYENFINHVKSNLDENPFGSVLKPNLVTESSKLNLWLTEPSSLPEGFSLGTAVTLNNIDGSKGTFKDVEIETSEAVSKFVSEGGIAKSIHLCMGDKASFTVTDKGVVKGIKPLSYTQERIDDYLGSDDSADELAELQVRTQIIAMDLFDIVSSFYNYSIDADDK